MAESTCSLYEIMLRASEEIDEVEFFRITAVSTGGTAHIECSSQAAAASNVYRYGIGRVSGKGTRQIASSGGAYSSGTGAGGKFSLAASLNSAAVVGEVLDVALWNANKFGKVTAAARAAIETSFPFWYREVVIDDNNTFESDGTTVCSRSVLDADIEEYAVDNDIAKLIKIGVHIGTTDEVQWLEPLDLWRAHHKSGSPRLRFYRGADGTYLPQKYERSTLCYHYMAKEPQPTDFTTATCKIPLDAVGLVAANIYKRRNLFQADSEIRTESAAIPQLQQAGAEAWAKLGFLKQPPKEGRKWGPY